MQSLPWLVRYRHNRIAAINGRDMLIRCRASDASKMDE
ncbi:MAG: hypothetical protein OJF49_003917 [Ktedonobacterales bacterium]|nr:MAG: hypothetical protein OJF49_003917 [Ktedonobacterales bacterium]